MTDRTVALDILSNVSIASPCNVSWESMKGDNRVRFCDECHLNVYNLSDMKAVDAAELVQRSEGRLCIKFYNRPDGTMLTADCPKGLRPKIRWAARRIAAALAAAVGLSLGSFGCQSLYWGTMAGCDIPETSNSTQSNRVQAGNTSSQPGRMSMKMGEAPTIRNRPTTRPDDDQLQRLR